MQGGRCQLRPGGACQAVPAPNKNVQGSAARAPPEHVPAQRVCAASVHGVQSVRGTPPRDQVTDLEGEDHAGQLPRDHGLKSVVEDGEVVHPADPACGHEGEGQEGGAA